MKIFLLEDDFALNESIKDMLEIESFLVDSFYDGKSAVSGLNNSYDIFILDIFVPKLNGIYLLEQIKKTNPNAFVIIMSASVDIDTIKNAYIKGCDDFIKKPFNIQELLYKLSKFKKDSIIFKFNDELIFEKLSKRLFFLDKEIELTKNEKSILTLLIENRGQSVNYEKIEEFVYKGEYKSIDAIRNLVKRLRKKLPYELIFTHIEDGYYIK